MRRDTEDIIKKAMEDSAKEIHDLEMELDEAIDLETASAERVELKPDEEVRIAGAHDFEVKQVRYCSEPDLKLFIGERDNGGCCCSK